MPEQITYEQAGVSGGDFLSAAYKSNGLVFTSGNVGVDPVTKAISDDISEQVHTSIQNVKKILEASGSSLDKVIKVLVFHKSKEDIKVINEIYKTYFPTKPARSAVITGFANDAVKFEIEVVAELN